MSKRWRVASLYLLLFGIVPLVWAATKLRSAAITNSTLDSSPVGSTTPSTGAFTTLTCTTCPAPIALFPTPKNLGSNQSLSANTLTTIDSITVNAAGGGSPAFPNSAGPWRVQVCYSYFATAGTGVTGESEVTDGTNVWAGGGTATSSGGSTYTACGWSPTTYPGNAGVTFTVKIKNTGTQTIATVSPVIGQNSNMSLAVVLSN